MENLRMENEKKPEQKRGKGSIITSLIAIGMWGLTCFTLVCADDPLSSTLYIGIIFSFVAIFLGFVAGGVGIYDIRKHGYSFFPVLGILLGVISCFPFLWLAYIVITSFIHIP